jgi:hypothetical protein
MHPNLNRASEASCAVDFMLFGFCSFTNGNRCSEHEIPFLAMIPKIEMVDHLNEANSFKRSILCGNSQMRCSAARRWATAHGGPTVTERHGRL